LTHPRVRDAAGVSLPSLDTRAERARDSRAWHALTPDVVATALATDLDAGLSTDEATARLAQHGPNELKREAKASVWAITLQQLRDPMNIMLVAVTVDKTTTR
jgi:Ca2+-transporting ATPase